jgi:hypothetical protein
MNYTEFMLIIQEAREEPPLEAKMSSKSKAPEIPLPKEWGSHVKSAILHVIALAQHALTSRRNWAADKTFDY